MTPVILDSATLDRGRQPQRPMQRPIEWRAVVHDRHGLVAAGFLAACLLLGGATASGAVANGMLQMLAIAILLWLALTARRSPADRSERQLLMMAFAALAVPLIQLIPMPPALWTAMPARGFVADGYALLGEPLPWLPLSLVPERTIIALLSLMPPLAMLLLVLRTAPDGRVALAMLVVAFALASLLLGVAQLGGGRQSALYFYTPTTIGAPVAFFANVNHHATLVLCALPLLGLLFARFTMAERARAIAGPAILFGAIAMLLVISLVLTRSMAAALLAAPALVGSALVAIPAWAPRQSGAWRRAALLAVGVVSIAAIVAVGFTLAGGIASTLGDPTEPVARPDILRATLGVALHNLPWGGGLGSFDQLYPAGLPIQAITRTFVNHAHNDYAELLAEAGVLGWLVLAPFGLWWAWNGIGAMRTVSLAEAPRRAGVVIIGLVLVHSLVDYPARTAAIMAITALGFGLLAGRPRER